MEILAAITALLKPARYNPEIKLSSETVAKRLRAYFSAIGDPSAAAKTQIAGLILQHSVDLSLEDQAILLAIAEQESGFDPAAKNPRSTAHGVFQIIDATWHNLGFPKEKRLCAEYQVLAGIELYRQNLSFLKKAEGPYGVERAVHMYTLHHDGPGGIDLGGEAIARRQVTRKFLQFKRLLLGQALL